MSTNTPGPSVLWEADPHTLAKHHILKYYLGAWAAVFWRSPQIPGKDLLFEDGFAGPGEYSGGHLGSPLVALKAISDHSVHATRPVRLDFTEIDPATHQHLRGLVNAERLKHADDKRVIIDEPVLGDCVEEIPKLISTRHPNVGPALFFLDQFGYSQIPMTLIRLIMRYPYCEVFSYLNCQKMNTYLADSDKWEGFTRAFGDESWRAALDAPNRQQALIDLYIEALKRNANVKYPWSFAMFDDGNRLLHWLVFSTNDLKGLAEMKKAMWSADKSGSFRFSDRDDPRQQRFFSTLDDDWLADELQKRLPGQKLSEAKVEEFVLTQTAAYNYKNAVNKLRKRGKALPVQKGKFPVEFV
jgi:three-Cys-motif partner protein